MNCGIYKILNKVNNKFYIGSSNNIKRRWMHHITYLNGGYHTNVHLQNAWSKYGKQAFEFSILEQINENELLLKEQYYLDFYKQNNPDLIYNISCVAGSPMKNLKHSKETIETLKHKLSGVNHPHYGKCVDEQWRRNISKNLKNFTDEQEIEFKNRWENGESKSSIAKKAGVHITTITRAIDRAKRFGY
jgi:group I intron endonuclease